MRAHFMIAVLITLAMFAVAQAVSSQYRIIGCTVDCDVYADNGIGLSLPSLEDQDDD